MSYLAFWVFRSDFVVLCRTILFRVRAQLPISITLLLPLSVPGMKSIEISIEHHFYIGNENFQLFQRSLF
jgi:hypothetical protein